MVKLVNGKTGRAEEMLKILKPADPKNRYAWYIGKTNMCDKMVKSENDKIRKR